MPVVLLLLALIGCTTPRPEPAPPAPPPPVVVSLPPVAVPPAAAARVVKRFDRANLKEPAVVFGSDITPEQIARIHQADQESRRALTALGREGKEMTPKAFRRAHDAVLRLEKALEQQ